jgi:hypothetical protein
MSAQTTEQKPFEELLKEKFNVTETELSERLTKATEWETKIPDYETQLTEKTNALTEREKLLQRYEGNPFVKTLADVAETNPEKINTYLKLSTIDVDKVDGLTAKKLRLELEKGWGAEDVNDEISINYPTPDKEKYDTDEDYNKAVEAYNRRVNRESADDKAWLKNHKEQIAFNPQSTKAKQEFEELKTKAETLPNLFNDPLEWNFEVNIEDKEKYGLNDEVKLGTTFKTEFDEETKGLLHNASKQFVVQQGIKDFSEENLKVVKNNILLLAKGRKYDSDLKAAVQKAITETTNTLHEFYTKKFSAPETRATKQNPAASGRTAAGEDKKEVVWDFSK